MHFLIGLLFMLGLISLIVPIKFLGISTRRRGLLVILSSFVLSVMVSVFTGSSTKQHDITPATVKLASTDSSSPSHELPRSVSEPSKWQYRETADKIRNQITRYASLDSDNLLNFDFPYSGGSTGTLTFRNSPKYGREVMLRIDKGQFMCSLDECVIQVKFDKGAVESFSATSPDDGSSTTLFIQNAASFTKRLRTFQNPDN